jgi:hypothetical protein
MVLPPFTGEEPTVRATMSPYLAHTLEFVQQFGTSPARVDILKGLLGYREALRTAGIMRFNGWTAASSKMSNR